MSMKPLLFTLLSTILLLAAPLTFASESSLSTMAGVVMQLNHYPTAADKTSLAKIIADSKATAGEKMLAGALMRMQHRVGDADSRKLHSLSGDTTAAKAERELADILLGIAHKASAADMKRLHRLTE